MEIPVYTKLPLAGSRLSLMGCLGVCWVWQRQTSQCFLVVSLPSSLPSRNSSRGLWLLFSVTRKPLFKLSKSVHSGMASLTTVGAALFDWPPCSFLSLRSPSVDLGRTQWERFRELFLWFHKPTPRLSLLYLFRQDHIWCHPCTVAFAWFGQIPTHSPLMWKTLQFTKTGERRLSCCP